MFLLLGSRCDLHGELMVAGGGMDRQRHLLESGLRRSLLDRRVLGRRLAAAGGECNEG
jgi:hypothetical protein